MNDNARTPLDDLEALAASIVCAMKYIPSAHIEGGEVSGTISQVLAIRLCFAPMSC